MRILASLSTALFETHAQCTIDRSFAISAWYFMVCFGKLPRRQRPGTISVFCTACQNRATAPSPCPHRYHGCFFNNMQLRTVRHRNA